MRRFEVIMRRLVYICYLRRFKPPPSINYILYLNCNLRRLRGILRRLRYFSTKKFFIFQLRRFKPSPRNYLCLFIYCIIYIFFHTAENIIYIYYVYWIFPLKNFLFFLVAAV